MRISQASSMAIYTDTHLGFALVLSMTTLTANYANCFDSLASTLLIRNPERSTTGDVDNREVCMLYFHEVHGNMHLSGQLPHHKVPVCSVV